MDSNHEGSADEGQADNSSLTSDTSAEHFTRRYAALIRDLSTGLFTHEQETLYAHARALERSGNIRAGIQDYVQLILATRDRIEHDELLDYRLVTAASNAISILNYGSLVSLFDFQFSEIADWSRCRIPHANLNMAVLTGCNFDQADLSGANLYCANVTGCSFRGANLKGVRLYESKTLLETRNSDDIVRFSPDSAYVAILPSAQAPVVWSTDLCRRLSPNQNRLSVTLPDDLDRIAFSPDGKTMAIGRITKADVFDISPFFDIWDLESGRVTHELDVSNAETSRRLVAAFNADGSLLVTCTGDYIFRDGEYRVWDVLDDYRLVQTGRCAATTHSIAFSNDSTHIFIASSGHVLTPSKDLITIIELQSGTVVANISLTNHSDLCGRTYHISQSKNGNFLLACGPQKVIDLSSHTVSESLGFVTYLEVQTSPVAPSSFQEYTSDEKGERPEVEAVAISWELNTARVCEEYGFPAVWKVNPWITFETKVPFRCIARAAVSPDGYYVVTKAGYLPGRGSRGFYLGELNPIVEWSIRLERHLLKQREPTIFGTATRSMALSPDGRCLIVAHVVEGATREEKLVRIFDVETGRYLDELESVMGTIHHVEVSRDGAFVIGAGSGGVTIWDFATRKKFQNVQRVFPEAEEEDNHNQDVDEEVEDDDEDEDQSTCFGLARLRSRTNARILETVELSEDLSSQTLVTGERTHNSNKWKQRFRGNHIDIGDLLCVALSPESATLVLHTAGFAALQLERSSQKVRALFASPYCAGSPFVHIVFAPDGVTYATIAITAFAFCLYVRRHSDGSEVMSRCVFVESLRTIPRAAYSHDSQRIVVAGPDAGIRVWDLSAGRLSQVFLGHERAVACAHFSSDDRFIFSGGLDRTIRVWDVASGSCVARVDTGDEITLMVVSPDDTRLFTASRWNGLIRVWRMSMDRIMMKMEMETKVSADSHAQAELKSDFTLNCISVERVIGMSQVTILRGNFDGAELDPWVRDFIQQPGQGSQPCYEQRESLEVPKWATRDHPVDQVYDSYDESVLSTDGEEEEEEEEEDTKEDVKEDVKHAEAPDEQVDPTSTKKGSENGSIVLVCVVVFGFVMMMSYFYRYWCTRESPEV